MVRSPPWHYGYRHGSWHEAEYPESKYLPNTKIPIPKPLKTTVDLFLMCRILGGTVISSQLQCKIPSEEWI